MSTTSPESPVDSRRPVVNFSRPNISRPGTSSQSTNSSSDPADNDNDAASVRTVIAFHDPKRDPPNAPKPTPSSDLPNEPRFSIDSTDAPIPVSTVATHASDDSSTASSARPLMPKSILKSTCVDQYSERASTSSRGEDTASHHTVSEDGGGEWKSSDGDTSRLSEAEVKKLERKGINPALWVEMKEAKGGKKGVGALTGNAYVS